MEFKDTLNYRQSIRFFKEQPIPTSELKEIVALAERTPSWTNSQPWHVYIATGKTLAKIKQEHITLAKQGIHGKPDYAFASPDTWDQQATANSMEWSTALGTFLGNDREQMALSQRRLFDAAALVYFTLPKTASKWSIYDVGAFGQTLMLAAADKHIDSIPAYEIVKNAEQLHEILGIPDDYDLVMGIALGYRDEKYRINHFRTDRADIDEVLTLKD